MNYPKLQSLHEMNHFLNGHKRNIAKNGSGKMLMALEF